MVGVEVNVLIDAVPQTIRENEIYLSNQFLPACRGKVLVGY